MGVKKGRLNDKNGHYPQILFECFSKNYLKILFVFKKVDLKNDYFSYNIVNVTSAGIGIALIVWHI